MRQRVLPRAERMAISFTPAGPADKLQIGDVGANQQQYEANGDEQEHRILVRVVPDRELADRCHAHMPGAKIGRIDIRQAQLDGVNFRICVFGSVARAELAHGKKCAPVSPRPLLRRQRKRQPEIGANREAERLRHDSDNCVGPVIDSYRPADQVRI